MLLPTALLALIGLLHPSLAYAPLSDDTLQQLPSPGDDFDIHKGAILAPILRTRVSGTPGNAQVLQHFIDFFEKHLPHWEITLHNSTSTTPVSNGKEIAFVNFIATRDPPGSKVGEVARLALAAHYDSKLTPHGFIGATDSAAPCAMILHAARSIDMALTKKWESAEGADDLELEEQRGVQILLLDGEEAFKVWTDDDSLYGARALASHWESLPHPTLSTYRTPLDSISLFMLLDLLGSSSPNVPSYFRTTHWAYKHMADLETRLRKLGAFKSSPNHPTKFAKRKAKNPKAKPRAEQPFLVDANKGNNEFYGGFVQDDHVPFMARGVEILHMIPTPFPRVWHELDDDGEHLDMDTVEDWTRLVTAFVAEWMELEGFFDFKEGKRKDEYVATGKSEL
ncbi:glutaminyl-peptide cyclotransferase precursor [Clohesyomyces aquaticus]|uniref:Peptide hydrolase n=1 Tax=Clohesyomyces aquaticus TaxID=1231657 RepID=A0A1Y1YI20_9PLEO|nr:glutaminyl-peptide cyclotransferase precursor [Clohesyomyces aquaticus]